MKANERDVVSPRRAVMEWWNTKLDGNDDSSYRPSLDRATIRHRADSDWAAT